MNNLFGTPVVATSVGGIPEQMPDGAKPYFHAARKC